MRGGGHGGGEVDPQPGFFEQVLALLASFGAGGEQEPDGLVVHVAQVHEVLQVAGRAVRLPWTTPGAS
jgi:hypothetical protein